MSSNIIVPLPKKSYAPSERVEKSSRYLYDIEDQGVTNIDTVYKEEKSREMWLRKPTHLLYWQKIILTQSTKERDHKHPKKQSVPSKIIKPTH